MKKTCKDFENALENKTRGTAAAVKPLVTTNTKNMTGISTIAIPQEKVSCNKVGTNTTLKFQQEKIPVLRRDIKNVTGGNLKNHLTKWKNVISD